MLWKERHTSIGGGLRWLGSRPMVLFFSVLLGCYLLDVAYPVLMGVLDGRQRIGSQAAINGALRGSSMALAVLGMLGVAASAAVSLTGEREQDTWISLATTLLTPDEVVRAKQLGAVWSARRVGMALLIMWAAGLLLGAIHPLGVLAAAIYVALIAWLIAVIGVFASSFAKNSTRALGTTFIAVLIFTGISRWPNVVWTVLVSYNDMARLQPRSLVTAQGFRSSISMAITAALVLAIQALIGALLTLICRRRLRATWGR
jgi:hypothetical protein